MQHFFLINDKNIILFAYLKTFILINHKDITLKDLFIPFWCILKKLLNRLTMKTWAYVIFQKLKIIFFCHLLLNCHKTFMFNVLDLIYICPDFCGHTDQISLQKRTSSIWTGCLCTLKPCYSHNQSRHQCIKTWQWRGYQRLMGLSESGPLLITVKYLKDKSWTWRPITKLDTSSEQPIHKLMIPWERWALLKGGGEDATGSLPASNLQKLFYLQNNFHVKPAKPKGT